MFWEDMHRNKILIDNCLGFTAWELNFGNVKRTRFTKDMRKVFQIMKEKIMEICSKTTNLVVILLIVSIFMMYAIKIFLAMTFSVVVWLYLKFCTNIFENLGSVKQTKQYYYIEKNYLVKEHMELFKLVNRSWNIQQKKESEAKLDELYSPGKRKNFIGDDPLASSGVIIKRQDSFSECDIEELFKMIEILFVHLLKSPERKRVERYLKTVAIPSQNCIHLEYDYTNSDSNEFEMTKTYTQSLLRSQSDRLILLEMVNNEVERYWDIKLDGNEFINLG